MIRLIQFSSDKSIKDWIRH